MSQAEDLLNSLSYNDISTKTEPHIVVGSNRVITVPSELKRIAVQYDHNIETVTFDCPRYWDDHDMPTMKVYINYTRADNEPGCYIADDVAVDETDTSIMHFSWTISRHVTEAVGPLTILVCIKMVDADGNEVNHWNSERNSEMTVSKGMECGDIIVNKYPDVITYLFEDMGDLADLTTKDKSSLVAAINEAAESGGSEDAVTYTPQTLTEEQKSQARANIGAGQPVFAVNVTGTVDDNYTADKTAAEIEAAYQAGRTIVCRCVVPLGFFKIPAELTLKSRMEERVFMFAFDQLVNNEQLVNKEIYTIIVNISDSGVEVFTNAANIYEQPVGGIPKSDLADDVQTSLDKADTAISLGLTAATPGQIIKVKTVQDGKPTEWEAVDMPSGDYEFVQSFKLSPDVAYYELASVAEYRSIRINVIRGTQDNALGNGNLSLRVGYAGNVAGSFAQLFLMTTGYKSDFYFGEVHAGREYAWGSLSYGNNMSTLTTGIGFGRFEAIDNKYKEILENIDQCVYSLLYSKPAETIDGQETVYVYGVRR